MKRHLLAAYDGTTEGSLTINLLPFYVLILNTVFRRIYPKTLSQAISYLPRALGSSDDMNHVRLSLLFTVAAHLC